MDVNENLRGKWIIQHFRYMFVTFSCMYGILATNVHLELKHHSGSKTYTQNNQNVRTSITYYHKHILTLPVPLTSHNPQCLPNKNIFIQNLSRSIENGRYVRVRKMQCTFVVDCQCYLVSSNNCIVCHILMKLYSNIFITQRLWSSDKRRLHW